jgi:uncharacterized protein with FMN-binding domain
MSARGHKDKGLPGKLLLSTALVLTTAGYGWWQKKPALPRETAAAPASTLQTVQAAPTDPGSGIGGYVFHEGPAAAAIAMPKGQSVADGEYTSQEWESGFGTVQIKVGISHGRFTRLDYLLVPDERQRSEEISHMAKPLLLHEMIHEQKAKVDIITTATYTTFAFQDALTDVLLQATRPPPKNAQLPEPLEPMYIGGQ